jgi:hypothetical protein
MVALVLALPLAVEAGNPVQSMTVISDTSTKITKVYNHAGATAAAVTPVVVDLSSEEFYAVRAWEPDPYEGDGTGTYLSECPVGCQTVEAEDSTWDTSVSPTANFFTASGADWIWETHRTGGPETNGETIEDDIGDGRYSPMSYVVANGYGAPYLNLYDANGARSGRVVLFEKTFTIPGTVVSGMLHLAADNGYEVWVNGTWVEKSTPVKGSNFPGWESLPLIETNLSTDGWKPYGSHDIASKLNPGANKLEVLAGNEYFYSDDGGQATDLLPERNPAALIFLIEIEYEKTITEVGGEVYAVDFSEPTSWVLWIGLGMTLVAGAVIGGIVIIKRRRTVEE